MNASADLADLSAVALATAIAARRVSPVEAVGAALARIERRAELNAFLTVAGEQALAAAHDAERAVGDGRPLGPLHGVPLSVKDLTPTAGLRTTMGSRLFAEQVPREDAVAVARARAAGAIVIGKTTTPEFGHKPFTEAPLFGRTLNPHDPARTCGGSSGGAAVAIATGMGPLALGTDGGGSIRIPAACCGIVGLKATLGAIPNLQPADLFGSNSFVGPMARNVADARLLFDAIVGPDRRDPWGQAAPAPVPTATPRVGWLLRCGNRALDPEVERLTSAAMRALEGSGIAIESVELDLASLEPDFLVLLESGFAARFGDRLEAERARLDPTMVRTIEKGMAHGGVRVQQASAARTACFARVQALLARFDVIASPTLSAPALPVGLDPHGRIEIAGVDAGTIRGAWYPYTFPFNLTGHPALSLPCGRTASGLPVGLQLVGRWHEDTRLLDLGARLELLLG